MRRNGTLEVLKASADLHEIGIDGRERRAGQGPADLFEILVARIGQIQDTALRLVQRVFRVRHLPIAPVGVPGFLAGIEVRHVLADGFFAIAAIDGLQPA